MLKMLQNHVKPLGSINRPSVSELKTNLKSVITAPNDNA